MKTTRFFTLFAALALTISAFAYDFQSGDLYYNITSNTYPYTVEVTYKAVKYSAEKTTPSFTNVMIPKSVRWSYNNIVYSVTSIGERAFHDCFYLTSVTIPNSVTSIGTSAFYNCSRLTSVTIPEIVTAISDSTFYKCNSLTSITIPSSVNFIGNCAFEECAKLTSVNIPAGITSISGYVFHKCSSLTSVTIPEGVTSIGSLAFSDTALDSVTIPESVTSIGIGAFSRTNLTSVIIPNTVTSLLGYTFSGCSRLTSITIPEHMTFIPTALAEGCSSLTSFAIPSGVTVIGSEAFRNCRSLTSITIPDGVTRIIVRAFENCTSLTSFTIPSGVTMIDEGVFSGCSSLASITIPSGVTEIRTAAFSGCSSLASITIPSGVTEIYPEAFSGCSSLASIIIPDGVTRISDRTFRGCVSLTSFTIPSGVTVIYREAFSGCRSLTSITIPDGVTRIWNETFKNCTSLTSFTIPSGVTQIDYYAFTNCTALRDVVCRSVTPPTLSAIAFPKNTGMTLKVPCSAVETYKTTTNWQDFTTILGSTFSGFNLALESNNTQYGIAQACPVCDNMIEAIAKPNCHFVRWNDGKTENPRTISLTSDSTFVATFAVDTYHVTATTNQTTLGMVTGSNIYEYNTPATIEAIANEGYGFVQWNDGNTENPRIVTVTSDSAFVATFDVNYTISVTSADAVMGTVVGGGKYVNNTQTTIEAVANEGYSFVQWNDGNTQNPRTFTVTSDSAFVATFDAKYTISVTSADAVMGTVVGSGKFMNNTQTTIEATPNDGYAFVQWNDGNTQNPRRFTVTSDSAFVATFELKSFNVTATTTQTAMGQVTGSGIYEYNTQATIEAVANEGYAFVEWNDGNTQNPRTFTVTSDSAFVAIFDANYTISVTSADAVMGTVVGSGKFMNNTQTTIEATPNDGYAFVQWNDLNTENPRTILVTSDATYTATFMTITAIEQVTAETLNIRIENGTILCDGDMRIYDLIGRDVTHQNGLLQGVYMVRVDNLVVKVMVK